MPTRCCGQEVAALVTGLHRRVGRLSWAAAEGRGHRREGSAIAAVAVRDGCGERQGKGVCKVVTGHIPANTMWDIGL